MFFSFWTTTSNTDSNQLNDPSEPLVEPTLGAQPFVQMTGYSEGTLELALMGLISTTVPSDQPYLAWESC